ncbi:calcium/sodium antiporter [Candidatus Peregrinibacteria bacterium]|nr:calcium/sodium antiporter [Candidatus Peregrinibacteria bacterium]
MLTYILFALGFVFLIKGADLLVDGSCSIAKRIGVSDLVIGLTIVSFGTSAPELLVNVMASIKGSSDIVVGNVIGSNIANIFLILGVSALIYPLRVRKSTTWKEIPLNVLAAVAILLLANDIFIDNAIGSYISRIDGFILILFFVVFMSYTFSLAKHENGENHKDKIFKYSLPVALLMTVAGIFGLTYGGKWVVEGAINIARVFGLSEAMIGATIIALGTSLPELAASAVAAYKHRTDIAIGNVVGSNIFNAFWVLGISAVINPILFKPELNADALIFLMATVMLFLFAITGGKNHIERHEGGIFVACYIGYIVFLVIRG